MRKDCKDVILTEMTERRKRVPESAIKELRFPNTPERLRLRKYNRYSWLLGHLRNGINSYKSEFELYDKTDPPTLSDEVTQAKFAKLTETIQTGNAQITGNLSPAVQQAIEIFDQECEKLKPVVMTQVRVTKSEHWVVLVWAENVAFGLEALLDKAGYPTPDPHEDAEASYIWSFSLLHQTTKMGDNLVKSDRIHFFDPDISINFSTGYDTNDLEVKRFNLALEMTPELPFFILGHLGFENLEELERVGIEDKRIITLKKAIELLYESSVKLDKNLPAYDKVYQDDFEGLSFGSITNPQRRE